MITHDPNANTGEHLKEKRVIKAATNRGVVFEAQNAHIDLSCLHDPKSKRVFPDTTVQKATHAAIVEIDEKQHIGPSYDLSCETARPAKIHEACMASLVGRPLLFIRINPDAFKVDGVTKRVLFRERMDKLVELLEK